MKFKKTKLLISLLSVGALTTILVPTITLTSCSSTANPHLEIFRSTDSNLTYNQTGSSSAQADVVDFEINETSKTAKVSIGSSTPKTEFNSNNSFVDGWNKIKNDQPTLNLPDSITGLKTQITDQKVLELIKNQNILNIFMDTINNLRNVYENFYSVFITKNSNIVDLVNKDTTKFLKYFSEGINNNKFYARLWLSDVKIDISINDMPTLIGDEGTEIAPKFWAIINNIKLKFEWFQATDNGSIKITSLDDLKAKGYQGDKLSFEFDSTINIKILFNMLQNKIDNKYYKTGLIRSDTEKPLVYNFKTDANQDEQNQNKTDWLNKEVLKLKNEKAVLKEEINNISAKIGFLLFNDLPKDNAFPKDVVNENNIKTGKEWLNKFIGINILL